MSVLEHRTNPHHGVIERCGVRMHMRGRHHGSRHRRRFGDGEGPGPVGTRARHIPPLSRSFDQHQQCLVVDPVHDLSCCDAPRLGARDVVDIRVAIPLQPRDPLAIR
jgi:hypothetical protein